MALVSDAMPDPVIRRLGPGDAEAFFALRLRSMHDGAAPDIDGG
jgi:hypothetical protein